VPATILLLSGTSEGPALARALLDAGFTVLATVTTEAGKTHLFGPLQQALTVLVGGFTEARLTDFLAQAGADLVLDATHPFAVRITRIASAVCATLRVPYVRYERPDWEPPEGTVYAVSYAEAATLLPSLGTRVMLTIGAKQLKYFATLHDRLTLLARILPVPTSLQQALQAGFTQANILCLRPPFSREFNGSLLREYRIDVLVTKASGVEGGVVEKVLAAQDLGIKTLMIRRPLADDLSTVSTSEAAVRACQDLLQDTHTVRGAG
jgi:precorrin-6A/cobalt-precorrin-6A reductase